jgi:hypothetical protein
MRLGSVSVACISALLNHLAVAVDDCGAVGERDGFAGAALGGGVGLEVVLSAQNLEKAQIYSEDTR